MHEATFRLSGTGALARLTASFDAAIALWCNDHCDLLYVRCPPASVDALREGIDDFAGVDDALVEDGTAVFVTGRCVRTLESAVVDDHLEAHGCLLLPPLRYEHGSRLCRVLALEGDRLTACYRDLSDAFDVTVEGTRELQGVPEAVRPTPVADGYESLTRRQRAAFETAFERGYYEVPRETTMAAVADALGVDRRTAAEHRRRAERKLLGAIADRYPTG